MSSIALVVHGNEERQDMVSLSASMYVNCFSKIRKSWNLWNQRIISGPLGARNYRLIPRAFHSLM